MKFYYCPQCMSSVDPVAQDDTTSWICPYCSTVLQERYVITNQSSTLNGPPDEYLGDGVYASWDGQYVWLDLRGQDNTTRIALNGDVLTALDAYWKRLRQQYGANVR